MVDRPGKERLNVRIDRETSLSIHKLISTSRIMNLYISPRAKNNVKFLAYHHNPKKRATQGFLDWLFDDNNITPEERELGKLSNYEQVQAFLKFYKLRPKNITNLIVCLFDTRVEKFVSWLEVNKMIKYKKFEV